MDTALALAQLFNLAAPGIASLILIIKNKSGTISIIPMLDEADAQFAANIKQAQDWLAAHKAA